MTNVRNITTLQDRMEGLLKQRQTILSMPPEQALDVIINSEKALPLVHSFAEEDLYMLVHDIGVEDALPILSLASARQWEYFLDLETWEKDRVSMPAVMDWFTLLLAADPSRLVEWLKKEKLALLELTFFKNIIVMVREHDEDPSIFGDDAITFDDVYYFKFVPPAIKTDDGSMVDEHRKSLLMDILKRIATEDHVAYQRILTEATSVIPAEVEEDMLRWRTVRLAEKGFFAFDEAIGIYQPLTRSEVENVARETVIKGRETRLPVSLSPAGMLDPKNLIARALEMLGETAEAGEIKSELAVLCNRIVVADQQVVRHRESLANVVNKACAYLTIGLHRLANLDASPEPGVAAELLKQYPLSTVFRTGYDMAMTLKQNAEQWKADSWFLKSGLPISFWGETWVGLLGGLLVKRPRFFDNYATGELYREFQSLADIRETGAALNRLMAVDRLLGKMGLPVPDLSGYPLTYKRLMLTAWARSCRGLEPSADPIPMADFRSFLSDLLPAGKSTSGEIHTVPLAMKQSFLDWLVGWSNQDEATIIEGTGTVLDDLFEELESEHGGIRPDDIDSRYISLFMVD